MRNPGPQSLVTTYRVKTPILGLSGKLLIDTVIPAGSTVEWQTGDYTAGLVSAFWVQRRVLVTESDLSKYCERVPTEGKKQWGHGCPILETSAQEVSAQRSGHE
jgi:hypothetical protein